MSGSEGRSTQQLFSEAKGIHSETKTSSSELQNKLEFMQKKIQDHSSFLNCGFCTRSNKNVDDAFKRAFKTLNLSQQVVLFWRMCKIKKQVKQKKINEQQHPLKSLNNPEKQMFDTTIYIKDKSQYKTWTVTRIKASLKSKKVIITDSSAVLDMHDYLIRSTKNKQRQCFALQATNQQEQFQTIKISNEGHSFDQTIAFFKKMKKMALYDQICSLVDPTVLQKQQVVQIKIPTKLAHRPSIRTSTMSSGNDIASMLQKMMTLKLVSPQYGKTPIKIVEKQMLERQRVIRLRDSSYNDIYKVLLPPKLIGTIEDTVSGWEKVKNADECEIYYNRKQQKVKKIYKLKCSDIIIFDWIVDQLNNFSNFRKWKPDMESISCLRVFPSQKTKVYHEIYKNNSKKLNYVFIRHHFEMPNHMANSTKSRKIYYFYDQSIVVPIAKEYFGVSQPIAQISYILWKFYQQNDTMNLIIEAKCDHFTTPENNLKMTEEYLGHFELLKNHAANYSFHQDQDTQVILNTVLFENQYIEKIEQIEDIDHDTEYFTIQDQQSSSKAKNLLTKKSSQTNIKLGNKLGVERRVSFEEMDLKNQQNLLKFKHPFLPYKKGKPVLVTPKTPGGHFHWQGQWNLNGKGQLINTNKEKIQAQNNVLKSVFKRLGRNIFSGKGILSISLPVDCFGSDSNLSRICNSYGYAPLFLQEAAAATDPVERFKKVMSFAISATVIYIRMDKPFNPILGETYQSLIDGCPVYGQQISHHPPISAVFMKGRGYTLHGHLQAKVQMSLNSASGINDGQIHISFNKQDPTKNCIKYTAPPGQLAGLIYGERKMSLIKKSYYFDADNLLWCEVKWGKQKGKSQFSNKYNDAVEATIVKLKPNFNKANWKNVKKQDIDHQIGMVNGRWTGAVFYDKELLFDTYQTFPYKVQTYHAMLESDVSKRKDLILRNSSIDLQQAQIAKQELQQIQRNDRKLRAKYSGKNH